jgi:hypothetical protein
VGQHHVVKTHELQLPDFVHLLKAGFLKVRDASGNEVVDFSVGKPKFVRNLFERSPFDSHLKRAILLMKPVGFSFLRANVFNSHVFCSSGNQYAAEDIVTQVIIFAPSYAHSWILGFLAYGA